ncbi:MAG TPA: substrate-binding domain-containing protein [Acidimicrobiales bacterium]|nr:substrate-binding domain-containing protein [Acidimicrobiales bacterium]
MNIRNHWPTKRLRIGALVGGAALVASVASVATVVPSSASTHHAAAKIKVAIVPKLLGLPVFEANVKGAQEVASKLGISLKYTAPATASAEGQVQIFNSLILQHYNVITLSSDDPTVPAPVLEKAMKAGIKVVTFDSDVIPAARNFFIQDTAYNTIAQGVIDAAVKFAGPNAQVAIMSSTPDATIQLAWIGAMKSYIKTKYPHLKIVTIGYGQSNQATSLTQAEDIIHSYPNVKAILPIDGAAVVGTAQAVQELGDAGKIGVFGIGDPLPNQKYFANNSLQALFLWNEVNQGKLVMYVAKLAYENKLKPGGTFTAGPLGKFTVAARPNAVTGATKDTIIFSKPLEFTKANYKKYDF